MHRTTHAGVALAALLLASLAAGCSSPSDDGTQDSGSSGAAAAATLDPATDAASPRAAAPTVAEDAQTLADLAGDAAAAAAGPGSPESAAEPSGDAAPATRAATSGAGPRAPAIPVGLPADVPFAPMGQPKHASLLDGVREYEGIEDPERESVHTGRREVGTMNGWELSGGQPSPQDLAESILAAVTWRDYDMLDELRITKEEFSHLCWPEFPQSRPATHILAGDAWAFHDANCRDGMRAALDAGGEPLHLAGIDYTVGLATYENFHLVKGVVIHAVDDDGGVRTFDWAPDFIERNGVWKVYMYKD